MTGKMTGRMTAAQCDKASGTKKLWSAPVLEVLDINAAEGAQAGSKCDKYGSLSVTKNGVICD